MKCVRIFIERLMYSFNSFVVCFFYHGEFLAIIYCIRWHINLFSTIASIHSFIHTLYAMRDGKYVSLSVIELHRKF